jgi:hypothetical protein
VVDLGKAVEKARLLHERVRQERIPIQATAKYLNYSLGGSRAGRVIAALRAY